MSVSCGTPRRPLPRQGERGEGRLKFLIVLAVLAVVAYSAYQYVPVAIQGYQLKDVMQQTVNTAALQPQTTSDALRKTLADRAQEYGAPPPPTTQVAVVIQDGRWQARVQYTKPIPFPFYTYQYSFDNTVKSFDPTTLR
ncbi:MAG TPA: hypothetical protein VJS44_16035 [Pyrinomonadaceae bacterium]|nr:hypothetical protein [Pyrinomonadaceae bacterium]